MIRGVIHIQIRSAQPEMIHLKKKDLQYKPDTMNVIGLIVGHRSQVRYII